MSKIKRSYTISEAAEITGLSVRMIDYLCRTEIVKPTASRRRGRGSKRLYSFGDLLQLKVIQELLRKGISPTRLKQALKKLRRHYKGIEPVGALSKRYLVTDGDAALFRDDKGVVDLLSEPDQYLFNFILDVEKARDEVAKSAQNVAQA